MSRISEFAQAFHARSVWGDSTELDIDAALAAVDVLKENPDGFYECSEGGCIGGMIIGLWFAPEVRVASELFWYADEPGEGARLRAAFESWAKDKGAAYVQMSVMSDEREPRLRRILARRGYNTKEVSLVKEL